MNKKSIFAALFVLNLAMFAFPVFSNGESWIKTLEIKSEPEEQGQKIYLFRFTPSKTAVYEEILFECVYRQELPWEDIKGRKFNKIIEPVVFVYRRNNVSFVNELDAEINFKVPVGYDLLSDKYGPTTFNKNYPITINRIRIIGKIGGSEVWRLELAGEDKFNVQSKTEIREPISGPS